MGGFTKLGDEIWDDFVTHALPASGVKKPAKSDIRAWAKTVEDIITGRVISVSDNGADVGHSDTTNQAAFSAAAAAALAEARPMLIDGAGSTPYQVSGTTDVSGVPFVFGDGGPDYSVVETTSATADVFTKNDFRPTVFQRFRIRGSGVRTAGAFISIDGTATGDIIREINMQSPYNGINIISSVGYRLEDNLIQEYVHTGTILQDVPAPDAGDATVGPQNFITTSNPAAVAGIFWASGGGLKCISNKLIGGDSGIYFAPAGSLSVNTSIFLVHSNSIENFTSYGVRFEKPVGTTVLSYLSILNNQINGELPIYLGPPATPWLETATIANNILTYGASGGIEIQSGNHVLVHHNMLRATVTDTVGITTGAAHPTACFMGFNQFINTSNFYNTNGNTGVFITDDAFFKATVPTTFSALPAAGATNFGQRRIITDCNTATFHATAAGGGSIKVPVFSDASNWLVG